MHLIASQEFHDNGKRHRKQRGVKLRRERGGSARVASALIALLHHSWNVKLSIANQMSHGMISPSLRMRSDFCKRQLYFHSGCRNTLPEFAGRGKVYCFLGHLERERRCWLKQLLLNVELLFLTSKLRHLLRNGVVRARSSL